MRARLGPILPPAPSRTRSPCRRAIAFLATEHPSLFGVEEEVVRPRRNELIPPSAGRCGGYRGGLKGRVGWGPRMLQKDHQQSHHANGKDSWKEKPTSVHVFLLR